MMMMIHAFDRLTITRLCLFPNTGDDQNSASVKKSKRGKRLFALKLIFIDLRYISLYKKIPTIMLVYSR
jgi:hypothetical protein